MGILDNLATWPQAAANRGISSCRDGTSHEPAGRRFSGLVQQFAGKGWEHRQLLGGDGQNLRSPPANPAGSRVEYNQRPRCQSRHLHR